MKIRIFFTVITLILINSCKDKNHYVVETTYRQFTANGDSTLRTITNIFNAATDSIAFYKGQEDYNKSIAKTDTSNGVAIRFVVRNGKGNVVLTPGSNEAQQIK